MTTLTTENGNQQVPSWEQRLQALEGLGEVCLRMRKPGDWYVDHAGVRIRDANTTRTIAQSAPSPEAAVFDYWLKLTSLPGSQSIEYRRGRLLRRVRWNGWMWADVDVDATDEANANEPAAAAAR